MEYLTPTELIGFKRGKIEVLVKLISCRLGELSTRMQRWLARLSDHQLDALAEAWFDFQNKADLDRWLKSEAAAKKSAEN